ncbi:MAG: spermidine/putrescine ABC transporter substrate-binding protein [Lentisphaeria bacterium]|jgi:spermidine/putrescine transport system substrate-binding protein|nr:spermidine/putrescine ABC transporter substrate-binding protein [Lentisphaeria bacterium]
MNLKHWMCGLAAATLALAAAGCGRRERQVLHVYTWADYVKPELVQRFEAEHNCKVVIDTFDSNEAMYAKLKAGATGYDLLFPSSYMVRVMRDQDMLQPLDHSLIPNLAHIDPDYLKVALDPEMEHSVPYMLTYTGIAYLDGRVPNPEATWAMFDRADLGGRATMLNDMRETIGAALKFLGYSLNTSDQGELEQARDVVLRWRRNLAKFENEQYKSGIASAEFLLVHGYSGDILQVQEENEDIVFVLPREGFSISCDDMVIPRGARQAALAHAFINFLHDPQVAAENSEFIYYVCPNLPSYELLPEEMRADETMFPPPEIRAKGEVIADLGKDQEKYVRIWDQIKAGQ